MSLETSVSVEVQDSGERKQASPGKGGRGGVTAHRECQLSSHCLLCCCLFVWPGGEAAIGSGGRGGGRCSPPHYLRLHLAVKWRNVFKASSDFTGALTASSCADVAACIVYVCVCEGLRSSCSLPGSHSALLFLENPLDGEARCLKSHASGQKWRERRSKKPNEGLCHKTRLVKRCRLKKGNKYLICDWTLIASSAAAWGNARLRRSHGTCLFGRYIFF